MKKSILSALALGLIAGTAMAQSFSFNGVLFPFGSVIASGSFSGNFTPGTGALTITGTTFYTGGSVGSAAAGPSITSGTVTPGPVTVAVGAGTSSSFQLLVAPPVDVFLNTRVQTFSGSGTATINVPQTVSMFDGATLRLTGTFTPVPEPETYAAVAGLGLVGYGVWRRRNA